jgi:hypothetical protein
MLLIYSPNSMLVLISKQLILLVPFYYILGLFVKDLQYDGHNWRNWPHSNYEFIMGRDHHGYFNNLDNEFLNKLKKLKIDFFIDMCLYSV